MSGEIDNRDASAAAACSVCRQTVAPDRYLIHDLAIVCGDCKAGYFQRLRELGSGLRATVPSLRDRLWVLGVNALWGTLLYWLISLIIGLLFQRAAFGVVFLLLSSLGSLAVWWYLQRSSRKFRLPWPAWPKAFLAPVLLLILIPALLFAAIIVLSMLAKSRPIDLHPTDTLAFILIFPFVFLLHTAVLLLLLWPVAVTVQRRQARAGE